MGIVEHEVVVNYPNFVESLICILWVCGRWGKDSMIGGDSMTMKYVIIRKDSMTEITRRQQLRRLGGRLEASSGQCMAAYPIHHIV
jgi:hypothetical protein